jgi:hypothetical protein
MAKDISSGSFDSPLLLSSLVLAQDGQYLGGHAQGLTPPREARIGGGLPKSHQTALFPAASGGPFLPKRIKKSN